MVLEGTRRKLVVSKVLSGSQEEAVRWLTE